MIKHSIIKRPVAAYQNYNYNQNNCVQPLKKLTQQELDDYLKTFPFKKGDVIYYAGNNKPYSTLDRVCQLNLVKDIQTDADKVEYDHYQQVPRVIVLASIGNGFTYPYQPLFTRNEHEKGWVKVSLDKYKEFMSDPLQDYLKKNNFEWNVPTDEEGTDTTQQA